MQELVQGNIFSPDFITIPTVQPPLPANDPVVYARGQSLAFYVKYPKNTKRLLFTISGRIYKAGSEIFKQIVFPDPKVEGVAEFSVGYDQTIKMPAGLYYWDIFQLRDDGSKDIWASYNKGSFNLIDMPSTYALEIDLTNPITDNIYNQDIAPTQEQPPTNVDFTIVNGTTWIQSLRWTSSGNIVDLTDYTAKLALKKRVDSPIPVFEFTTENGMITLGGVTGMINIQATAEQTQSIPPGYYVYDLILKLGEFETRLLNGTMKVESSIGE
jgi:hypothetical protein